MKLLRNLAVTLFAALGLISLSGQAQAVVVDSELVLAIDISVSVDAGEFNLQRQGYVDAFNSAAVASAIAGGPTGSIAVSSCVLGLEYGHVGQNVVGRQTGRLPQLASKHGRLGPTAFKELK